MTQPADSPMSQVDLLHRVSEIVSSELSLDEVLGEVLGLTVQVTSCEACLVYLIEKDTEEVVLRASQLPHAAELGSLRMRVGEGITGWVAEHKSVVALTSNLGSSHFNTSRCVGFDTGLPDAARLEQTVLESAKRALNPELWNRIEHRLVFHPLALPEVREIARRQLSSSAQQLAEERGISFRVDESVLDWLAAHGGFDPELGARPMRQTIEREIESQIASRILGGELRHGDVVRVDCGQAGELTFAKEV